MSRSNGILVSGLFAAFFLSAGCRTAQKTFPTPEAGVAALGAALEADNVAELEAIFGPEGHDLISSGDETADRVARRRAVDLFEEKHRLEKTADDVAVLCLGDLDWPFPVPLVKEENGWVFDTVEGKEELLDRRIGKNELSAIQVCRAYVDAQEEYARTDWDGDGILEYAQGLGSTAGKKDGLYWPTAPGEKPSPLGPLVAQAVKEGYERQGDDDRPAPYHGYLYRILTSQGPHAAGGAYDYIVNGNMMGGFALIASPVEYGSSGIMTFVVNHDGIVHQKDLGESTSAAAMAIHTYDPDGSWSIPEE